MSGEGEEGVKKETMPKWESEFWSLLSSGDGENCPLRCQYESRQPGCWCIDVNKDSIAGLVYLVNDGNELLYDKFDFPKNYSNCEILNKLERLAQRWLERRRVSRPPVPSDIITQADEHQRIDIRLVPLKTYSGAIWRLKDGWVIHIKEDDLSARQRFTICHEAFHILAHCRIENPVFRKIGTELGKFNEVLADAFAMFLLLPEEWVRTKWAETKNIEDLARIFWTSVPVMYGRLKMLGLI